MARFKSSSARTCDSVAVVKYNITEPSISILTIKKGQVCILSLGIDARRSKDNFPVIVVVNSSQETPFLAVISGLTGSDALICIRNSGKFRKKCHIGYMSAQYLAMSPKVNLQTHTNHFKIFILEKNL